MTHKPATFCLIVTTFKKQVYKLKLVEEANIAFQLENRYFSRKFTESAAKQWTKGVVE